jgi:hypothetical protein
MTSPTDTPDWENCPHCDGAEGSYVKVDDDWDWQDCPYCEGTGGRNLT